MPSHLESDSHDADLVAEALDGDVRALESLLDRHESRVLRVLRLMGVPHQDREDVAQEVFLRVFRHLRGFHRGRPFRSWIYKISVNAAHDYRNRSRGQAQAESESIDADPGWESSAAASGESGEAHYLRIALEGALGSLSSRERAVFVLRELEGLESRDVARALGITTITVRRHLGRARARLQEILEETPSPGFVATPKKNFAGD